MTIPAVLTIAGSDSSGGAGIQADLKTMTTLGCFGMSVITALTAQNTQGVGDIHPVPAAFVTAQLDAVCQDIPPSAVKIGMVYDVPQIHAIAAGIQAYGLSPVIVDPVMVATSGASLLERHAQAPLEELARILRYYGEERFAGRVAQAIVREREVRPISTTSHLAEVVERAIPQKAGKTHGGRAINPATRTFQALRIAVNRELESLQRGLEAAIGLLRPGGRLVVNSYHSLEDRIVKEAIRSRLGHCTCPPRVPFCTCGAQATLREVTRRPLTPGEEELELNPRSRSAKLRVAERL